jgi:hypothetical protein
MAQLDSVEFLESAFSKWRLYHERQRTAISEETLVDHIQLNQASDILGILSVEAPWASFGISIGICQFRRTWSNNVTIDFLTVHPLLLGTPRAISGVGTALLYCVAKLAHRIEARNVWLETTDLSVNYYSRLFGTPDTSDLAVIPTAAFYDNLRQRFGDSD